jgi:hypothetical protein
MAMASTSNLSPDVVRPASNFCSALKLLHDNYFYKKVSPTISPSPLITEHDPAHWGRTLSTDINQFSLQFPSIIGSEDEIGADPKIQFELFGKFWKT